MSRDMQDEFSDMTGFSLRNLKYMRQWFQFWSTDPAIGQQLVAQIPWGTTFKHRESYHSGNKSNASLLGWVPESI